MTNYLKLDQRSVWFSPNLIYNVLLAGRSQGGKIEVVLSKNSKVESSPKKFAYACLIDNIEVCEDSIRLLQLEN